MYSRTDRYLAVLALAGAVWAGAAVPQGRGDARPPARPNVVLILADDVGREVLGCYGGRSYKTPSLDRLAAGGVRLTHAYTMPVCHPTRICLLTGQYPFRLGHPDWGTFPSEAEGRTLARVLKNAGYATAIAGKWQLALLKDDLEQPHRMGFDEYALFGWHEGPWYYQPHIWQNGRRRDDVRARYGPDVVCEFLIDFMDRHKSTPFFAFYSMSLCHAETNDLERPAPVGPHGHYDSYAEMAAKMDQNVGRIVEALEARGLRESTLVIFTADNGTAAHNLIDAEGDEYIYEPVISLMDGQKVAGGKATLTDWGTRVPFIVNWPGVLQSGQVSDVLTDASDLFPTLVEATAASLPRDVLLDGRSLWPALRGEATAERPWMFAEHKGRYFVRDRRWKLYADGQLFDMHADPDEEAPVVERSPGESETARQKLQQALAELNFAQKPD
jgi:arylsulfatase A-like enzyme